MKELVVISGKGGTGKTSIVASFAVLARPAVMADCDVDAADLHLVLSPTIRRKEDFSAGSRAKVITESCTGCGKCQQMCRFDAISSDGQADNAAGKVYRVDPIACEGCGVCAYFCPADAIDFSPVINGQWFHSQTRCGPMVHAALGVAEENSGKLVTLVRREAKALAVRENLELILVDGSPGIGCPVIASVAGADLALVVAEPTLSGQHDLARVADLVRHFGIPAMVCISKWDLNGELADQIEAEAGARGLEVAGRVRYDPNVTAAQVAEQAVVKFTSSGASEDINALWNRVTARLDTA